MYSFPMILFIIIRLIHLLMIQCEHQNIRIQRNSMNKKVDYQKKSNPTARF